MIHAKHLIPGTRLRLVEENPEAILVSDATRVRRADYLKPGTIFIVYRALAPSVVLQPEAEPKDDFHVNLRSGLLYGFKVFDSKRDELDKTADKIEEALVEHKEQFGDHIKEWDQRQLSPEQKKEAEQRQQTLQKLMQLKKERGEIGTEAPEPEALS